MAAIEPPAAPAEVSDPAQRTRSKLKPALCLPKGLVDEGEKALDAALREVREETGITAAPIIKLADIKYVYVRSWGDGERVFKIVSFYLLRYESGRIDNITEEMRIEVACAKWIRLEDAPKLLSYRGEKQMARKALDYLRTLKFDRTKSRLAHSKGKMHPPKKTIVATTIEVLVCIVVVAGGGVQAQSNQSATCSNPGFNPRPWLEDFAQLTTEMSTHYSNLEWAIQDRHMDLPALRRETEAKLGRSCDEHEARHVLELFLKSFGDGHLEIRWPQATVAAADSPQSEPTSLCARLGYKKSNLKPGVDFAQLPQFSQVGGEDAEWFPGGILRVTDTARLGVIRIALFSEHAFPDACQQVVQELHLQDSAKCDTRCEDTIERESSNRLTAALVRRAAQLRAAGASAILVDITHNGGGSNWVEPLPRVLSSVPLRESRFGFIKHGHWTSQLKERLADVDTDLKKGAGPKDVLEDAATRLRTAITRSQETCDRSAVWTDGSLKCTLLVSDALFASGLLNYAPPGAFRSLESRTTLFHPEFYTYSESSDRLPLYVVVDGDTWSAAEYFAAILQDNGAATILGNVTGGAGCGYTNGGIPSTLKNSRAVVKMPDCVRLRKDTSNENVGVVPDIWIPWTVHDNSYTSAQKLFHSLLIVFTQKKEADHEAH